MYGSKNADVETLSLKSTVFNAIVNVVKERGFLTQDDYYGRTSAVSSSNVKEVTAILYYKIRYLINAKNASMMEEMLPIGIKVYDDLLEEGGDPVINIDFTVKLWEDFIKGLTTNYPGNIKQVYENMKELFERKDYDTLVNKEINERLKEVIVQATLTKQNLSEKKLSTPEELEGMDQIEIISFDPISLTLFYPKGDN